MWQVLKCVWQTSFICQITAPCTSQPSIFCLWGGREWSASKMRARLESVIRAWMHWHLSGAQGVEMAFLGIPVAVYKHVFQENSPYSPHHEQRLQAIRNRWANLPAFGAYFLLPGAGMATLVQGGEALVGKGMSGWLLPCLWGQGTGREQGWNVHCWISNRSQAVPTHPAPGLPELTKAGDTTAIPLMRSWLQPQLLCGTEWMCSFPFSAQGQDRGSPRRCHTNPNCLSYSSFSVLAFWRKKPHTLLTILAPSKQVVQPSLYCFPQNTLRAWVLAPLAFE